MKITLKGNAIKQVNVLAKSGKCLGDFTVCEDDTVEICLDLDTINLDVMIPTLRNVVGDDLVDAAIRQLQRLNALRILSELTT